MFKTWNPYIYIMSNIASLQNCNQVANPGEGCGGPAYQCDEFNTTVPLYGGCWFCLDLFGGSEQNRERLDRINGIVDGQATPLGCGYGCFSCDDFPDKWTGYADDVTGTRFLMPYIAREGEPEYQNRDARGFISDVHSSKPHLMPKIVYYRRGVTFQQKTESQEALECLDDACNDGYPIPNFAPGVDEICEHGERKNEPMLGRFPDCFAYHGIDIPSPNAGTMYCRCVQNRKGPDLVIFKHQAYFQTQFHRSSTNAINCCTNILAPMWSLIKTGINCYASFEYEQQRLLQQTGTRQYYYFEGPRKTYLNKVNIGREVIPKFNLDGTDGEKQTTDVKIKNIILDYVLTNDLAYGRDNIFNFTQLDKQDDIGMWSRGFNGNNAIPCDQLPVIQFAEGQPQIKARLRNSKCPVDIHLVVTNAFIDVNIVANKVRYFNGDAQIFPHVSVLIGIDLAVRAQFPKELLVPPADKLKRKPGTRVRSVRPEEIDTCKPPRLLQSWLPEDWPNREIFLKIDTIDNCYLHKHPRVIGGLWDEELQQVVYDLNLPTVDFIDYYVEEDGETSPFGELPLYVEWKGQLNSFSNPNSQLNSFDGNIGLGLNTDIYDFLRGMKNVKIPGWNMFLDQWPKTPNKIYTGGLNIMFDQINVESITGIEPIESVEPVKQPKSGPRPGLIQTQDDCESYGFIWNNGRCFDPACPAGYYHNFITGECELRCEHGFVWDLVTWGCVPE